jgi:hypothetical protein
VGATAVDWEDVAIGPGPAPAQDYLYIGDTGDNTRRRTSIAVVTTQPRLNLDGFCIEKHTYSSDVTTQPRLNLDGFCIEKHTYSSDNGDDATSTTPNTRASSYSIPAR